MGQYTTSRAGGGTLVQLPLIRHIRARIVRATVAPLTRRCLARQTAPYTYSGAPLPVVTFRRDYADHNETGLVGGVGWFLSQAVIGPGQPVRPISLHHREEAESRKFGAR